MKKTNEVTIKKYYYLALLTLSLYLSPFLILGEDSYIIIKDTLDFSLPNFKTLAESGKIFSDSNTVMNEMMSANRRSFESEFNFVLLLFYFFEPFTAYTINQCIIRLVALIGMYLLLNKYIFYSQNYLYNLIISLLYSLLPFYSLIGLSVAGLPLITFFFLNIRNEKDNKRDWFGIILFPFYSSFIYSIIFYIIFLLIIWIHDVYKNKSLKKFSIAILIFFSLFIFVNYRLFDQIFFEQSFVSHRVEMETKNYNLFLAIPLSIKHFFFGHIHTLSLHIFFLPLILFVFFVQFFRASKYKLFLILLCVNGFISLWYGFGGSGFFWSINNFLNAYGSPDIKRFYYLSPFIWYVLFAMSVKYLLSNYNFKFTKTIILLFCLFTLIYVFYKSDFVREYKQNKITYKQFYSEKLFTEIKNYIGNNQSEYKVASIGIHPSISRYNGFYTLDGYLNNYDLKYKKSFRGIISSEINKNEKIKNYYDKWGSRSYIFVNDIGTNLLRKKNEVYSINININTNALRLLGGTYIFSAYEIKNFKENKLIFLKKFTNTEAAWDIFLYKVN